MGKVLEIGPGMEGLLERVQCQVTPKRALHAPVPPENPILAGSRPLIDNRPQQWDAPARPGYSPDGLHQCR